MNERVRNAFLESFAEFPDYEFIWKYEGEIQEEEVFKNYTNVHPFDWLDQMAILGKNGLRLRGKLFLGKFPEEFLGKGLRKDSRNLELLKKIKMP